MEKKPKQPWTEEQFRKRIADTQEDINSINKLLNETFIKISTIVEERIHLKKKMGKKQKYINKLEQTIIENFGVKKPDEQVGQTITIYAHPAFGFDNEEPPKS